LSFGADLPEMADYGVNVFVSALTRPELGPGSIGVTIAVAVVGLVLRRMLARRRHAATA
jgi:hypothetical protein